MNCYIFKVLCRSPTQKGSGVSAGILFHISNFRCLQVVIIFLSLWKLVQPDEQGQGYAAHFKAFKNTREPEFPKNKRVVSINIHLNYVNLKA